MKIISGNKVIYKFTNLMDHVEVISSGDVIKVKTNDCFFQQIYNEEQVLTEIDYDRLNPATGPIYVEGAEQGDLLQVKVISIDVANKGVAAVVPNEGVLGDQVSKPMIRVVDIIDGYAIFHGIKLPIRPMIGVIGVAPAKEDGEWATDSPWKHGGNMDTNDITAGSTLYFPVNQKGALLALGDCHAIMGDGEICFTGLEVPAEVTLEINLIKDKKIKWPLLETDGYTMVIASGNNLDSALYEATSETVKYLEGALGLEWEDAYILTSLAVDLKISQVVDPKKTIRAAIPKYIISTERLIQSL
ncbi:acetamidase/formamidase family protein [uncultured Tissierella sp.]|uniref:acetamidase/formamidase family protein n=1 Tax=uncultured Tissierella sp. TaxID=448160 RepID=UPI002804AC37|nr:acetamidase/formamidase family protein [uncultured Tissierella sp.]MDU5081850.1 acetamidase/formamidase family protein [Bacillota bacterium]